LGFLLKSAFVIALVYFALHKDEIVASLARARGGSEMAADGERRTVGVKDDALTALQRAAAARLAGAAREHCLANTRDCLTLLKAAGADSSKRGAGDRWAPRLIESQ